MVGDGPREEEHTEQAAEVMSWSNIFQKNVVLPTLVTD